MVTDRVVHEARGADDRVDLRLGEHRDRPPGARLHPGEQLDRVLARAVVVVDRPLDEPVDHGAVELPAVRGDRVEVEAELGGAELLDPDPGGDVDGEPREDPLVGVDRCFRWPPEFLPGDVGGDHRPEARVEIREVTHRVRQDRACLRESEERHLQGWLSSIDDAWELVPPVSGPRTFRERRGGHSCCRHGWYSCVPFAAVVRVEPERDLVGVVAEPAAGELEVGELAVTCPALNGGGGDVEAVGYLSDSEKCPPPSMSPFAVIDPLLPSPRCA